MAEPEVAPTVSIIVPARDEELTIGACLHSLAAQTIGARRLEVIVVAAGGDRTAEVAAREGTGRFGRFEVVRQKSGNKNAALQVGCARACGDTVLLLDADTEPDAPAVAELLRCLESNPHSVAHAAMRARITTWVSRYAEMQRKLTKEIRFDGNLNGGLIALPRAALGAADLPQLLPEWVGASDDAHLGRALRGRGWRIVYAGKAQATTLFPWTLRGLLASTLRNRRGVMAGLPLSEAAVQATVSAVLVAAAPAALLAAPHSAVLALGCTTPLLLYAVLFAWGVEQLRRRGLGDYRRGLPVYLGLEIVGRGLKLWAFLERLAGRRPPSTFRGQRPAADLAAEQG